MRNAYGSEAAHLHLHSIYRFDGHNNKFTRTQLIDNMVGVKIAKHSICEPQLEETNRCTKETADTATATVQEASKRGNTIMNNISKTTKYAQRTIMHGRTS